MNIRSIIGLTALAPYIVGSILSASTTACAPKSRYRGPVNLSKTGDLGALQTNEQANKVNDNTRQELISIDSPEKAKAAQELSSLIKITGYDASESEAVVEFEVMDKSGNIFRNTMTAQSPELNKKNEMTVTEVSDGLFPAKSSLKEIGLENLKATIQFDSIQLNDSVATLVLTNGTSRAVLEISKTDKIVSANIEDAAITVSQLIVKDAVSQKLTEILTVNGKEVSARLNGSLSKKGELLVESGNLKKAEVAEVGAVAILLLTTQDDQIIELTLADDVAKTAGESEQLIEKIDFEEKEEKNSAKSAIKVGNKGNNFRTGPQQTQSK